MINKYLLIPILITLVWIIALVVAGFPADIIIPFVPILGMGHLFGYFLAMRHVKNKQ